MSRTQQGVLVVHEDPSAALNPSEEQWHQIVQSNLKKFEEDKMKKQREKMDKLKRVQEEQKLQMQKK